LEISGDVLSTADMVVQRRDGPRRLREIDDDDDMAPCGFRNTSFFMFTFYIAVEIISANSISTVLVIRFVCSLISE